MNSGKSCLQTRYLVNSEKVILSGLEDYHKLLFSNIPRGAKTSAAMYSIVKSAKASRLERFLFSRLPEA